MCHYLAVAAYGRSLAELYRFHTSRALAGPHRQTNVESVRYVVAHPLHGNLPRHDLPAYVNRLFFR